MPKNEPQTDPQDAPFPTGLMMALAQNMHAWGGYAALSEQGRARLIAKARQVHSREEMLSLVNHLSDFQ
ncbi:MAG: hypothetical protein IJF08_04255 [Clostridia bacterium]|nr:hypothetical protein [Clostridia bacterium]